MISRPCDSLAPLLDDANNETKGTYSSSSSSSGSSTSSSSGSSCFRLRVDILSDCDQIRYQNNLLIKESRESCADSNERDSQERGSWGKANPQAGELGPHAVIASERRQLAESRPERRGVVLIAARVCNEKTVTYGKVEVLKTSCADS